MKIIKEYSFEAAHIVRGAYSERCRFNIHGHSYRVEFGISGVEDNIGMVIDFGRLKPIKDFVDLFDHSFILWAGDTADFKQFIKATNRRWVEMPLNSTAESLAIVFYLFAKRFLRDNFPSLLIEYVRVWETANSSAIFSLKDLERKGSFRVKLEFGHSKDLGYPKILEL